MVRKWEKNWNFWTSFARSSNAYKSFNPFLLEILHHHEKHSQEQKSGCDRSWECWSGSGERAKRSRIKWVFLEKSQTRTIQPNSLEEAFWFLIPLSPFLYVQRETTFDSSDAYLHRSSSFAGCRVTIFERRSLPGGIWQYDEPGECIFKFDANGQAYPTSEAVRAFPASPMYDGLRTNIASDLMSFRDSPFEKGTELFPSRNQVNRYLQDWAEKENLTHLIRFDTAVTSVRKVGSVWQIKSTNLKKSIETVEQYDFVIVSTRRWSAMIEEITNDIWLSSLSQVASGRCNEPSIPFIAGLWNFKGEMLHSAWYRDPTVFRNKVRNGFKVSLSLKTFWHSNLVFFLRLFSFLGTKVPEWM